MLLIVFVYGVLVIDYMMIKFVIAFKYPKEASSGKRDGVGSY